MTHYGLIAALVLAVYLIGRSEGRHERRAMRYERRVK